MAVDYPIMDCIYGEISLPPLCVAFMDTPEFQRLRRVKQLGMVHYVFPSATHSRFEHCIGVCILAGRLVDRIGLPYHVGMVRWDVLRTKHLIQLGALYHDIGHFAYSHLFDTFLRTTKVTDGFEMDPIFTYSDHEDRSIYLLRQVNARLQLLSWEEERFVGNCILGLVPTGEPAYLYEIVANRKCGIDVDRLDYLARDAFHCGLLQM